MELRSSTNKGVSNTVWGYAPDRGEVITLPTTPQAFTPITGSKDEGWGLLKKIYDGEKSILQTITFPYSPH